MRRQARSVHLNRQSVPKILGKGSKFVNRPKWLERKTQSDPEAKPVLDRRHPQKWLWGSLWALVALQFYYVREMLAALVLFSIVFAVVGFIVLILFVLDRGIRRTLALTDPFTAPVTSRVAKSARHAWSLAEETGRKLLHRIEQPAGH
jgi:hypothetical protein